MAQTTIQCELCGEKYDGYFGLENFHFGEKARVYSACVNCSQKVKKYLDGIKVINPEKEKEIIKRCLWYCLHRKRSHPESGLGVCVKDIERVLDEIDKDKK